MQKQNTISTILVIILLLTFMNDGQAQILPTKLSMTITDNQENKVEGAEVYIYTTEKDYRASENAVFSGISNKKGKLMFKEAKTILYFIDVKKGDMTNIGQGVQTGPLTKGKITKVNIVIE